MLLAWLGFLTALAPLLTELVKLYQQCKQDQYQPKHKKKRH